MKKVIFSLIVLLSTVSVTTATAQALVSVRIRKPVYYCPVKVVVAAPPPQVIVVNPVPVVVASVRPVVVVPTPTYVATRPRRIVVYR